MSLFDTFSEAEQSDEQLYQEISKVGFTSLALIRACNVCSPSVNIAICLDRQM